MMFSSHIDMIYKHSALQDMLLNCCLSSVGSPRRYMYSLHEKVISDYTNIKQICYKGGKFSQLWVSSCSTHEIQWVASGKKSAFWFILPLLS